ncbi:MAG: exodeoxyribonuclease VII large subunit [Gemmatimonadota bacterium]
MLAPGAAIESALGVGELAGYATEALEAAFPGLWVKGEVSNFKRHSNGHWYFSLKDAVGQLPAVVWARDARRIPAPPDEGMSVFARGTLSLWTGQGKLQFMVDAIEAEGAGLWQKAFDTLKATLDAEGLTAASRKRPLPRYPSHVAVITSGDGAAWRDIQAVIRRRHPGVHLTLIPAVVQGELAPASLVQALDRLVRWGGADVAIIGRGGGSREDLWAFNHEAVARAVAACPIPVISAVGHETDFTITDFVADERAATPSVAAERAVQVLEELRAGIRALGGRLSDALEDRVDREGRRLRAHADGLRLRAGRAVERRRARIERVAGRLEALSPLGVLARGFAVARGADGRPLVRRGAFTVGERFDLLLTDGRVTARTESIDASAPHLRTG